MIFYQTDSHTLIVLSNIFFCLFKNNFESIFVDKRAPWEFLCGGKNKEFFITNSKLKFHTLFQSQ